MWTYAMLNKSREKKSGKILFLSNVTSQLQWAKYEMNAVWKHFLAWQEFVSSLQ